MLKMEPLWKMARGAYYLCEIEGKWLKGSVFIEGEEKE
jgi:hypothetical protein